MDGRLELVGVIKVFDKKGPHAGKFSVKYKDDPNWCTHNLCVRVLEKTSMLFYWPSAVLQKNPIIIKSPTMRGLFTAILFKVPEAFEKDRSRSEMEACVDLEGPRASPLAIHRW